MPLRLDGMIHVNDEVVVATCQRSPEGELKVQVVRVIPENLRSELA